MVGDVYFDNLFILQIIWSKVHTAPSSKFGQTSYRAVMAIADRHGMS